MGDLVPITKHEDYVPVKVRACLFYSVDNKLNENAKELYFFLSKVCKRDYGVNYLPWPTMEDAVEQIIRSEFGKDLQMYAIKNAFSNLRKNGYLRHTYNRVLAARILELREYIGENATD